MKVAVSFIVSVALLSAGGCCGALRNLMGNRGAPCGSCPQAAAPNYLSAAPCENGCTVGSPVISGMVGSDYYGGSEYMDGSIVGEYPGVGYGTGGYVGEGYPIDGSYPISGGYSPGIISGDNWVPTVPQGSSLPQQVIPAPTNK